MVRIKLTEGKLRRIIREAIEEAWSGIEDVVDKDDLTREALKKGFRYIAYHNTDDDDLTFFDVRSSGIHFGSRVAADERGLVRGRDNWTNEYFLKIDNPLVVDKDFDWEHQDVYNDMTQEDYDEWEKEFGAERYLADNYGLDYGKTDENGELQYPYDLEEMLSQKGYDCIVYKNEMEDAGNYSVAMFNPKHIKLACVTHDDNGNEIPLEDRFDVNKNDVRY